VTIAQNRQIQWIAIFILLSWFGEYIHNRVELPDLKLLSLENSIPALISIVLFFVWWRSPNKRPPSLVFLGWAFVQLVGGIVSVIPFSFLPFYPPQTLQHYLMHVVYAAAQLPLIVALIRQLRLNSLNKMVTRANV
jgi:hypothetical protein